MFAGNAAVLRGALQPVNALDRPGAPLRLASDSGQPLRRPLDLNEPVVRPASQAAVCRWDGVSATRTRTDALLGGRCARGL